jgi:hypothetical protein
MPSLFLSDVEDGNRPGLVEQVFGAALNTARVHLNSGLAEAEKRGAYDEAFAEAAMAAEQICLRALTELELTAAGAREARGERAVASFLAAVLTEIYLCASCSCHEILRSATARVRAAAGGARVAESGVGGGGGGGTDQVTTCPSHSRAVWRAKIYLCQACHPPRS